MTETGNTMDRLRREVGPEKFNCFLPVYIEDIRALLAVVEAAQEYREAEVRLEHRPHVTEDEHIRTEGWRYLDGTVYSEDEHSRRLSAWEAVSDKLDKSLAALHSQASDEGKPAE